MHSVNKSGSWHQNKSFLIVGTTFLQIECRVNKISSTVPFNFD